MCAVLDDLVIARYVTVDELLGKRPGPGRPPRLSDAELVCLAVAQVLLGCDSDRRWLRFVGHRLGHLFAYVPGQSGYNRRLRAAGPALRLAWSTWPAPHRRGGPVAAAGRHPGAVWRLPGDSAALGAGRVGQLWLGAQPLAPGLGPQAVPAGRSGRHGGGLGTCHPRLGSASRGRAAGAGQRPRAAGPGDGHRRRQGPGRPGLRPTDRRARRGAGPADRRDEPHRFGSLGRFRQWVESTFDTRKDQLGLERHGAHTPQGLWVRVAQRLLALAAGIWFNWQLGINDKRSLVAYDH